jgi:hypothetical protein
MHREDLMRRDLFSEIVLISSAVLLSASLLTIVVAALLRV